MNNDIDIKLTKSQKDFIGSTFPTPKGGVLTVTGVSRDYDSNGSNIKFTVECSLCIQDAELFQEEFVALKTNLTKGKCPCGCTRTPRWSEYQNKIRVQRECDKRGYIFHGWFGGYSKNKTYLDLENPETGNRWTSVNLNHLLSGNGDPVEGALKSKDSHLKPDEDHIQEFHKAGFTEGYKFWRSDRVNKYGWKPYWYYTCSVCSCDEYVQDELCSGIFENTTSNLKKGLKSCRCSKNYKWTQEQREYQINKICEEEGLTFLGWETEEGYKNSHSKFVWLCPEGHECTTTVNNFLNGKRCKTCSDIKQRASGNLYGYFPERKDETDFLYVINFDNQYVKVGRAFDIHERMKGSRGLLKLSNMSPDQLTILKVFTATHQEVYDIEQWIHEELTQRGFYHEDSTWTIETFDTDSELLIYRLLEESYLMECEV